MEIEELLLHYSPDAPLRAWRLFRVHPDGDGLVLSSPIFHNPDPVPWSEVSAKATCHEGHPAPAPGCRCGIYGAAPGTLDSLPGYLVDTAYERDPWAYAEVGCSGRVFVDMRGVRAERAEILRIALREDGWEDEAARARAIGSLSKRYDIPVVELAEAPDWVIRNAGDTGPPPKGARLALDLRTLTLETARVDH